MTIGEIDCATTVSQSSLFRVSRNTAFRETGLLERAANRLRATLPSTWTAELAGARAPFDATLTISSGSSAATFTVEAKASLQSSAQVIGQLRHLAESSPHPLLFVTEYINSPLRRECEANGFGYLDTTGWTYIVSEEPPVLVRLAGAGKPPNPRGNAPTARLNGPAAGRTIRCLLELTPPIGIRQLAERASSSPAAVSKLMPALVEAGAVDRSAEGTVIQIRRRALLDRWTADYTFLNSNGPVFDYVAPRGLPWLMNRIRDRDDLCVTGSAAAREYLPPTTTSVVPLTLFTMYAKDIAGIAESLGLVRTSRETSNVIIAALRDPLLLREPAISEKGFPIAPLGQVLADLLSLPGRMAQEAEQLIDTLAVQDPAWRD
ncbi:hypothetical protein [Amycolatopsis sp. NPDC059657]|uniref:hypothetical protein n=1 Tax=Amycolatopsis sp. NPDC059657 TaxID=3346899 RepID=UPI00366F91E7